METVKRKNTQTEVFKASANDQQEANEVVEVKYRFWKAQARKSGFEVEELSRAKDVRQINAVHWKCELVVTYCQVKKA